MKLSEENFDAIIVGSGIGGLVTASQLAAKGAKVLVLEKYIIPGGSGGSFKRKGYTFDVGASMIFRISKINITNTSIFEKRNAFRRGANNRHRGICRCCCGRPVGGIKCFLISQK
jgi:choline dehydrogenase-like flavoprotein